MTVMTGSKIKILKEGHVTSPEGFSAGGVHCGLRKKKLDFGWIRSEVPASAAGVYTLNAFRAAPLKITKASLDKDGKLQAIVVNSANANACTGRQGELDALEMQKLSAEKMGMEPDMVAVASTGVIGVPMPMEKIYQGIGMMDEADDAMSFEEAILTTDTVTKHFAVQLDIDGKQVTIGGAAKGSGMIHPNMATMLSFITTDAAVEPESLNLALRKTTDKTFNMITVDGDCSTNDMVLVLANGKKNNRVLSETHPEWGGFTNALQMVMEELAKMIAKDGEGATKLIEVTVKGASSEETAKKIAKTIISSNLVKTAVFGADPNWGRIVCAAGYSGEPVNPEKICISLGNLEVVNKGLPLPFDEMEGKAYLKNGEVKLTVDLQDGVHEATAWGCDLTYDYVKINASYRT